MDEKDKMTIHMGKIKVQLIESNKRVTKHKNMSAIW